MKELTYCYASGSWLYCQDRELNEYKISIREVLTNVRTVIKNIIREDDVSKLNELISMAGKYYLITSDAEGNTLLKIYEDPALSKEIMSFVVV